MTGPIFAIQYNGGRRTDGVTESYQEDSRFKTLFEQLLIIATQSINVAIEQWCFETIRLANFQLYLKAERNPSVLKTKLSKYGFTYCSDRKSAICIGCCAELNLDWFHTVANDANDQLTVLKFFFEVLDLHAAMCSTLAKTTERRSNIPLLSSEVFESPLQGNAEITTLDWEAMIKQIKNTSIINREGVLNMLRNAAENEQSRTQRDSTSNYSRLVHLMYLLAPAHTSILTETFTDIRGRTREIRYERNHHDSQEQEAYAHRSEHARWRSFFDDVGSTRSYTTTSSAQDKYTNWGRSLLLAYYLVKLGFYYAPKSNQNVPLRDKIRCAFCKRGKMGWWLYHFRESWCSLTYRASDLEVAIAIWKWHRSKSPTCPAVIDLAVDSLPFDSAQKREVFGLLTQPYLPLTIGQDEANIALRGGGSNILSGTLTDSGFSSESSRLRASSNSSGTGRDRLKDVWPSSESRQLSCLPSDSPQPYAANVSEQFYTPGQAAFIEASCLEPTVVNNVCEHKWMEENNHIEDYTLPRPEFDVRISTLTKHVPRYPLFVSQSAREISFYRSTSTDQTNESERHVNDSFCTKENLLASGLEPGHDAWQTEKPSACKMSIAGFFATLCGDQVLCYFCGLQLTEWKLMDNCWVEHAFHSPECAHVLTHRGVAFVREVKQRYDVQVSSASWISSTYSDVSGFFPIITRRVEPRDYRSRPEVRLFRAINEDVGLNSTLFAYAIECEMRRTGNDFANYVELLEAVHELETRMELVGVNDARDFVKRCNSEADAISRGMHTSQMTAVITAQQEDVANTESADVQNTAPSDTEDSSDRRTTCTVCLDQPLEVAFVPCGHLATCFGCSTRLTDCPVCRTLIRGTLRVRM